MAKDSVADWDTTASNNTDIGGTSIVGSANVSNFDNALRTLMAQVAAARPIAGGYATSYTTAEMLQARENIGASDGQISDTTLTPGASFVDIALPTGYESFTLTLSEVRGAVACALFVNLWVPIGGLITTASYFSSLDFSNGPNTIQRQSRAAQTSFQISALISSSAGEGLHGYIHLLPGGGSAAARPAIFADATHYAASPGTWERVNTNGVLVNGERANFIRLSPNGTTFAAGRVILKGSKA